MIDKALLGLAGELATACELCRRNIYAQPTFRTHKRTDLLCETEKAMLRIQVKAKQAKEWPGIQGIKGDDIVLVLVDFEGRDVNDRPDFYILTPEDWKELVKERCLKDIERGFTTLEDGYMPLWKRAGKQYKGIGVRPAWIKKHGEKWTKIEKHMK
jgi:hypothetical protein